MAPLGSDAEFGLFIIRGDVSATVSIARKTVLNRTLSLIAIMLFVVVSGSRYLVLDS